MISGVSATENNTQTHQNNADTTQTIENIKTDTETATQYSNENTAKEIIKNTQTTAKTESSTTKSDPSIRLSSSEITPGKDKTFLALLPSDATGSADFKINNEKISNNITVEDGQVMYTYKIPTTYTSEKYNLSLVYYGDSKYNSKTANATLTLVPEGGKVNASMTMKNVTSKYSKTVTLRVTLNKTAFGNVTFKIDNKTVSTVKIKNGVATAQYTKKLIPNNYTITATYNGNYMFEKTTVNSTLTVKKLNSMIKVNNVTSKAGKLTFFKAKVTDELRNTVSNMKVQFKLNSHVMGTNRTDSKGIVKLYYTLPSSLYKKQYNITATAVTTNTIAKSTNESVLTLKQLKTKVAVPAISTIPSKTIVLTATVVDEFNNYVTKGSVKFVKDNKAIATVKISNGFAKYRYRTNYQTANKTYLYAYYVGDWKYASSTGKGTYKITMLRTSTTSTSVFAKPNSRITINATVRDQNQKLATDGKVKFYLSGKSIGTAKVRNGIARVKYSLSSYNAGNYRIRCKYYGSKIYKNSSNTNTLTVSRYGTNIEGSSVNAIVGKKTPISVSVTDEENYNVNKGTVKFYVNEKYVGRAKVSKGVATIYYKVPSIYDGKIVKYYAAYVKNGMYDSSSCTDTMTVSHQKTVYVSPYGNDSNLGDKKHPFKTLKHALSHITLFGTVKLKAGTYSASGITLENSISIIGSGKYKTFINGGNSGKSMFNITKRNAVITIRGVTIMNGKSSTQFSAGAIVSSGKLHIINSRLENNTGRGAYSGGAIYSNGILNVTNTIFKNNVVTNANGQGGAIRTYNNDTYITSCRFDSNRITGSNSTGGSAIYGDGSDIIINMTTFTKNSVKGKYITGGVIRSIYGAVVIADSTFTSNMATSTNYAVGGVVGSISSGVSVINSTFNSNTIEAKSLAGGGVLYVEAAALDVVNSKISSNKLTAPYTYGGAVYGYNAHINLTGDTFTSNRLISNGDSYGGVLYILGGKLTVDRTTFNKNEIKSNTIALAGAVYTYSNTKVTNSNFINNTINAKSLGGGSIANMGNLTVSQSNFINNYAYNSGNEITTTSTASNNINNNYWGSSSPKWTTLLYNLAKPSTYSKNKFNN